MTELFDARLRADDTPMLSDELVDALATADVLVPTVTDRIDANLLNAAGNKLALIANFGAGVDNIDLDIAQSRNITVTNTPAVLTEDTADMAMAMIDVRRASSDDRCTIVSCRRHLSSQNGYEMV